MTAFPKARPQAAGAARDAGHRWRACFIKLESLSAACRPGNIRTALRGGKSRDEFHRCPQPNLGLIRTSFIPLLSLKALEP